MREHQNYLTSQLQVQPFATDRSWKRKGEKIQKRARNRSFHAALTCHYKGKIVIIRLQVRQTALRRSILFRKIRSTVSHPQGGYERQKPHRSALA